MESKRTKKPILVGIVIAVIVGIVVSYFVSFSGQENQMQEQDIEITEEGIVIEPIESAEIQNEQRVFTGTAFEGIGVGNP